MLCTVKKAKTMMPAKPKQVALLLAELGIFCCVSGSTRWSCSVQECIATYTSTHSTLTAEMYLLASGARSTS